MAEIPGREDFLPVEDGALDDSLGEKNNAAMASIMDKVGAFEESTTSFSMEKMAHFLRHGSESQQTVILFEIQQLLQHCFEETVNSLVPVLCACVPHRSEELQLSASEAFSDIVQQPIPAKFTKMIVDMAFEIVQITRTEDTFEAWGEILVVVLPEVEWESEDETKKVFQVVDEFSKTDHEGCRKLAARVLGALSASLKSESVKNSVLSRALAMAGDPDVEVRGMVAESFSFIGAELDLRLTEKTLWPRLLSLMTDPDARIHAACLRSMAHILEAKRKDIPNSSIFRKLLPPVFANECSFAKKAASEDQRTVDDDSYLLLEIMAEVFGPFLHAVHSFLSEENKKDAFKAFLAMSTCNGPIVRRYCAFNLPGVALSLRSSCKAELSGISEFLSRDPDSETRWNLAAGIHKTCSILMSKNSMPNLHKAAIALLQDENPLVRMNTLENFHELVLALQLASDSEKCADSSVVPFFKRLTPLSEGNWRTQELLAKQLKQISELVPPHCLQDNILPLLYQMAEEGTHRVRKESMLAIAKTIWCIPLPDEREKVLQNFHQEWGQGGVYWMRIAFVDCAHAAIKVFSNDLYAYLFLPAIYQLARDNVPNVRLRVARMLHELAPFCHNDIEFCKTVSWLKDDGDPDVRWTMMNIDDKMKLELKHLKAYRKDNEAREDKEARWEESAVREKNGRRGAKTKMKASAILPKIATRAGHLSPTHDISTESLISPLSDSGDSQSPRGNGFSPRNSVPSPKRSMRSPRNSPLRLSLMLTGHGKSKDRNNNSTEEAGSVESSPRSASRKALKQLLSVASPRRSKHDSNGTLSPRKSNPLSPRSNKNSQR